MVSLRFLRDPLTSATLGAGVIALLLLGISGWLAYDTQSRARELLPLSESVGLRISGAHLWMEEKMGGDPAIDLQSQVYANIDVAIELLGSARQDLAIRRGLFESRAEAAALRGRFVRLERLVVEWRRLTVHRFANVSTSGIGSALDHDFDLSFQKIIQLTQEISVEVRDEVAREFSRVLLLDGLSAGCVVLLFGALAVFVRRSRVASALRHEELEALAASRTAELRILRDITELKESRRVLLQDKEAAERTAQAKSDFLANMSHEIRTPLNAVIGMTGLLLGTPLDAEQADYVETVRSSGEALLTVINDILDFSKIEAGRLELEGESFSVRLCVEEVLDLVAAPAAAKGLDLLYEVGSEVPEGLLGDVGRVRQVLLNLLSNAVKFTAKGEVEVIVSAEQEGEQHRVRFAVHDTGIGIPEDRMDRLFLSFSQVDASTTRRFGGSGLGLAISRRLAEAMGGVLEAESEAGRGSTFHFTLVAVAVPPPEGTAFLKPVPELAGKRLLVVDDNAANRRILTAQCGGWGFEVQTAEAPRTALEWLRDGSLFDLAILDMHMPEMDGLMLAREIRRLDGPSRALPLVILSSLGDRFLGEDARLFTAQLTKPVRPAALHAVLAAAFDAAARVSGGASPSPPAPPASAAADWRPPEGLRLLLVDDNPVNQKVSTRILERHGVRADVAFNGLEALEAIARQPYDVVLMDVQMPEMDGFEATRRIRAREEGTQPWIVAMTAGALEGDRELCLAAGMDDYLSKPVRVGDLMAALRRFTEAQAAAAKASGG